MLDEPWRYGPAMLLGFIGGVLAFIIQQVVALGGKPGEVPTELATVFVLGGVALSCGMAFLHNRAIRRSFELYRRERQTLMQLERETSEPSRN